MISYQNERIHFIGVGGASMSALAKFVIEKGGSVTGSDREKSIVTNELEKLFPVYYGETPWIVDGCTKIVYSSAISSDNLELKRAIDLGIPVLERHEFLGDISKKFQKTIAVAGAHGKTTVTAMIAHAMKKLDANFSAHIGGETEYGNLILSGEDFFVTEACEYKKSLLSLFPYISIVLNIELDHPDCYDTIESLVTVYLAFLEKGEIQIFPANLLDICKNEHISIYEYEKMSYALKCVEKVGDMSKDDVIVFSNGKMVIWSKNNRGFADENPHIVICKNHDTYFEIDMVDNNPIASQNTLVCLAVLDLLGYNLGDVAETLKSFKGVKRRKEFVGRLDGASVVFDYAHHPTQIRGIISSFEGRKLVVFQPHTYTRTQAYFDDFVSALSLADRLIIMDTYGAREGAIEGADSMALARQISTKIAKDRVEYIKSTSKTIECVISEGKHYDNILFLGAGDIYLLKDKLAPYLK